MMNVKGYKAECKKCQKVFDRNETQQMENMPPSCKCGGDVAVVPEFEDTTKALNYEVSILCKETGVTLRDGITVEPQKFKELSLSELQKNVQIELADAFMRLISVSKDSKDDSNIRKLLWQRN